MGLRSNHHEVFPYGNNLYLYRAQQRSAFHKPVKDKEKIFIFAGIFRQVQLEDLFNEFERKTHDIISPGVETI